MYVVKHGNRVSAIYQHECDICNCLYRFEYKDIKETPMGRHYVICPECGHLLIAPTYKDFDLFRCDKEKDND